MSYDNACKYLAEQYPTEFVSWLLSVQSQDIKVLKTELTLEPIRADSEAVARNERLRLRSYKRRTKSYT